MARKLTAYEAPDGTWSIRGIPVFAEHKAVLPPEEEGGKPREIDVNAAELDRMRRLSEARRKFDGYLPSLHVNHTGDANKHGGSYYGGRFRLSKVAPTMFEGREQAVLYSDWVGIPADVYADIKSGKLAYVSPQVDFADRELNSIALMDHHTPHFRFGAIRIGNEVRQPSRDSAPAVYRAGEYATGGGNVTVNYARMSRAANYDGSTYVADEPPKTPDSPGPIDMPEDEDGPLDMEDLLEDEEEVDYEEELPANDKKVGEEEPAKFNREAASPEMRALWDANQQMAARLAKNEERAQYSRCVSKAVRDLTARGWDPKVVRKNAASYLKDGGIKSFEAYYSTMMAVPPIKSARPGDPPSKFTDNEPPEGPDDTIPAHYSAEARTAAAMYAREYMQHKKSGMKLVASMPDYVDRLLVNKGLVDPTETRKAKAAEGAK